MPPKTFGKVERYGADWHVSASPDVMMKLKRWFPRVQANRKGALVVRATPEVSRDIEWILDRYPMEMEPTVKTLLHKESEEDRTLEVDALDILNGGELKRELKWQVPEARDYQLTAADLALRTGRLLVADDLGLGKTLTCLLTLRDAGLLPALIVCQTHLTQQWADQIAEFMPWLTTHIAKKGTPYKLAKYHDGKRPDVLIMNYAKLAGWAPALRGKVKAVICDEAQELRREGSQKYEAAGMICDAAEVVVFATATPIYNYGDEVFNVMDCLKAGCLGSREEFIREWGKHMGNGHIGVKDPVALREHLINQHLMIQRTRKELGRELPETTVTHYSIESDDSEFERLMEGEERNADLLVSREASKEELFTLSGEFEWKLRRATGVAKAPFVAEFAKTVLESQKQVVLFGWHHDVYDVWREKLKEFNPVFYTGQESPAKKLFAKQQFLDGEARVFCMSLRAGAGLDGLQAVSNVAIFGELDWSPTMHEQCVGRLRRDGMHDPVLAYFMVSENGSDPMIADTLNLKRTQSEPFMDPNSKLLTVKTIEGSKGQRLAEDFLKRK